MSLGHADVLKSGHDVLIAMSDDSIAFYRCPTVRGSRGDLRTSGDSSGGHIRVTIESQPFSPILIQASLAVYHRAAVVVLLLIVCSSGCVRRRMTVRSNPPGALVFVDGQEVGRTPVATSFTYYGTRNIRLIKDGYETISVNQPFRAPWYQVPPLDFVSENMVPNEIRDDREVNFELVPRVNVSMNDVLIHADQLRSEVVPASATAP